MKVNANALSYMYVMSEMCQNAVQLTMNITMKIHYTLTIAWKGYKAEIYRKMSSSSVFPVTSTAFMVEKEFEEIIPENVKP